MTEVFLVSAGWSSPVARQAHNLKVVSSNLAPATTFPYSNARIWPPYALVPGVTFLLCAGERHRSRVVSSPE